MAASGISGRFGAPRSRVSAPGRTEVVRAELRKRLRTRLPTRAGVVVGDDPAESRLGPPSSKLRRTLLSRLRGYRSAEWMTKRGLRLGRDVYLGQVSFDYGFLWLISIGDESTLVNDVRILAHDASTKLSTGYTRIGRVDIGRRVYIGAGSTVLPGVRIGDGAIVGAGSVVSRDVPPQTVVAGVPAVPITTLEEFTAKHTAQMAQRPRFSEAEFSGYEGIPAENIERMRRELKDGPGYVD
jgi:maltose O-acetyltransferase